MCQLKSIGEEHLWCDGDYKCRCWPSDVDPTRAIDLFYDAMDAADVSRCYCDRESSVVDSEVEEIVRALLTAGWRIPKNG